MKKIVFSVMLAVLAAASCAMTGQNAGSESSDNNKNNIQDSIMTTSNTSGCTHVLINTSLGDIEIALYNNTPKHRDNFLKLVRDGYYNGVLFHRVIKDFMIQTGDPKSKNAAPGDMLGAGDPGYTSEAEIVYPE